MQQKMRQTLILKNESSEISIDLIKYLKDLELRSSLLDFFKI